MEALRLGLAEVTAGSESQSVVPLGSVQAEPFAMQLARSLSSDSATPLGVESKLPGIRFRFTIKRYLVLSCLELSLVFNSVLAGVV